MLNFIQSLIEVFKYLWPFRIVEQWERGVLYVRGRHWARWPARRGDRTFGPGVYLLVPYFMTMRTCGVVPFVVTTPLLQIEVGGKPLTFSATATMQIYDAAAAWNNIDSVLDTVVEILAAVTAEWLPLTTDRGRLRDLVNKELARLQSGTRVLALRFTNYASVRPYRLLMDTALLDASLQQ